MEKYHLLVTIIPLPSRLAHNIEQSTMCSRSLMIIHLKCSSVYMTFQEVGLGENGYVCICVWLRPFAVHHNTVNRLYHSTK